MRSLLVLIVVCAATRVAAAGEVNWDGTYVRDSDGGGELCPHIAGPVTVTKGAFSIPWNIRTGDDRLLVVGTLVGSVRPSGLATLTATVFDPLAASTVADLAQMDDSVDKLKELGTTLHVRFSHSVDDLTLEVNGTDCAVSWTNDAPLPPPTSTGSTPRGKPTPAAKPTKPATGSKPATGAKPATPAAAPASTPAPSPAPAVKLKPPPPLAAGSTTWDASYLHTSRYSADWRCPNMPFKTLVVSKGRFSFPYTVTARSSRGEDYGEMTLGRIDGSIPASGKVKLRTWFSIEALPPELTVGRKPKEATLDYVHAFTPTMTFTADGQARYATLTYGPDCEIHFESASSFKAGRSVAPAPRKAVGATCHHASDCASDLCESGRCHAARSVNDDDDRDDDGDDDRDDDDRDDDDRDDD